MSFKDQIKKDLTNVFVRQDEFAEIFIVNGVSISAIEDGDDLVKRIRTDYGGIAVGDLLLHVTEAEWAKVPKIRHPPIQGEVVNINNTPMTVFTCSRDMGMLDIIFQRKRS